MCVTIYDSKCLQVWMRSCRRCKVAPEHETHGSVMECDNQCKRDSKDVREATAFQDNKHMGLLCMVQQTARLIGANANFAAFYPKIDEQSCRSVSPAKLLETHSRLLQHLETEIKKEARRCSIERNDLLYLKHVPEP